MRYAPAVLAALLLGGCSVLDTDVQRGYTQGAGWTTPATFTTADVRMVTERQHPLLRNTVICTEPSPDVAKALATAVQLAAQGGNGAANGSLGFNGSSAEAAMELAGRSTALLALRDGMYRACEAYANGVIGQDAYALVLSRYGQLMTTLFLGQDITGAAGVAGSAAPINAVIQSIPALPTPPGATKSTTSSTTTNQSTTTAPAASVTSTSASIPAAAMLMKANMVGPTPKFMLVQAAAPAPGTQQQSAADTKAPTPTPNANTPSTPNGNTTTPPANSAATVSATTALALTRMNEDYMALDLDLTHLLVVACINENDPTRLRKPTFDPAASTPPSAQVPTLFNDANPWLASICKDLTLTEIKAEQAAMAGILKEIPALQPINPTATQTGSTTPKSPTGGSTPQVNATIVAVQLALQKESCTGCKDTVADGLTGPKTTAAVKAYQTSKNLPVNGDPLDAKTLQALGVTPPKAAGA
jgi:hypothetical protein